MCEVANVARGFGFLFGLLGLTMTAWPAWWARLRRIFGMTTLTTASGIRQAGIAFVVLGALALVYSLVAGCRA